MLMRESNALPARSPNCCSLKLLRCRFVYSNPWSFKASRPRQTNEAMRYFFFNRDKTTDRFKIPRLSGRLLNFMLAVPPPPPRLPHPPLRRTSPASARSQCSPPDPNSKVRIRVFPTGPQLLALDCSVPRWTRTASTGSECSPPNLNCKR